MSQLLEEQQKTVKKHMYKASDVFLHATETQCSGSFIMKGINGEKKYCAVGLLGLYSGGFEGDGFMPSFDKIYERFGELDQKRVKCPECEYESSIMSLLPHLNNDAMNSVYTSHGWSFKEIGKWLQGLGY